MAYGKDLIKWSGSPISRLFNLNRFDDIFGEFDRIFRDWDLDMKTFSDMQPKSNFPKVNVAELEDGYEVEVALAGFDKEDIGIELKENSLCIKADKKSKVCEDKKYLMKEISSKSFRRVINFPSKVMTDNIECVHQDGIVRCTFKKEPPMPNKDNTIKIDIM